MSDTISERWNWLTNRTVALPVFVRRFHRIVAMLWILSFALSLAVDAAGGEIPGPSIPALTFVALVLTGSYLLLRPWVRGSTTVSDRLNGLTSWSRTPSVVVRRTHRIVATLFLLALVLALGISVLGVGDPESPLVIVPIVAFLAYLAITGLSMFLRPWVNRVRAR